MKHKDLDSQNRYQKAWDAMMAQADRKPQKTEPVEEPRIVWDRFDWTAFCIGFCAAVGWLLLMGVVVAIAGR